MNAAFFRPLTLLIAGLFPLAARCADTAAEFSPVRMFALELLLLAPLAGLAYWLKFKRRKSAPANAAANHAIMAGELRPLGDGAYAQVIECRGTPFLVVRSKTGAIHATPVPLPPTPPSTSVPDPEGNSP